MGERPIKRAGMETREREGRQRARVYCQVNQTQSTYLFLLASVRPPPAEEISLRQRGGGRYVNRRARAGVRGAGLNERYGRGILEAIIRRLDRDSSFLCN